MSEQFQPDEPVGQPVRFPAAESNGVAVKPEAVSRPSISRWLIWIVLSLGFALFLLVGRVHTYLGVKVQPTTLVVGSYVRTTYDKNGHDYVWRVWWRARHQVLEMGPNWGFPLLLAVLTALFVAISVLAVWVALVPTDTSDLGSATPDLEPSGLR